MQRNLSIVIICKNESRHIDRTLTSVKHLVEDVVVYDSGSTDGTAELVEGMGIPVHRGPWMGFGPTRRHATTLAKNDWVFCLDGDEWLGNRLADELDEMEFESGTAYRVNLRNHLGKRHIKWGAWGNDRRVRLFHRHECNWSDATIHESVVAFKPVYYETLPGSVIHRTAKDINDYRNKLNSYAKLTAEKYFADGKKASFVRRCFSPFYTFLKNYVLKLGFLEGSTGLKLALATAGYTRIKYKHLRKLEMGKS
jgi:glycosyltransferase involved in cell wall biosynthesis